MPTLKRAPKNIVTTTGGTKYKVQANRIVKRLGVGFTYFALTNTIFNLFVRLYRSNEPAFEVVVYGGKGAVVTFTAEKNSLGGFSIGCNKFDAKNSRKFFRLVGVTNSSITRFFPQAKAAAAGR